MERFRVPRLLLVLAQLFVFALSPAQAAAQQSGFNSTLNAPLNATDYPVPADLSGIHFYLITVDVGKNVHSLRPFQSTLSYSRILWN